MKPRSYFCTFVTGLRSLPSMYKRRYSATGLWQGTFQSSTSVLALAKLSFIALCSSVLVSTTADAAAPKANKLPTSFTVSDDAIQRARSAYEEMLTKTPLYENKSAQEFVTGVGQRLTKVAPPSNISYQFAILDNEGVMAYSFAGGQIVVSRGMLAHLNSEAELAAVIAHEIGHVAGLHQSHIFEQADRATQLHDRLTKRFTSDQARELLATLSVARVRGYGRDQEVAADAYGEQLLALAGYDPVAAARMLNFLVQYDLFAEKVGVRLSVLPDSDFGGGVFASHPSSKARLELSMKRLHINEVAAASPDKSYLEAIDNLPFGVAARYGIQRDALFVCTKQRIAFAVPKGWYVFGSGEEVIATPNDFRSIARVTFAASTMDESIRDAVRRHTRFERTSPTLLSVSGNRGKIATLLDESDAPAAFDAVLDVGTQRVYVRGLAADTKSFAEHREPLLAMIESLRAATTAELAWEPQRLHFAQASEAGVVTASTAFADHQQEYSELLNQLFPGGKVAAKQWIKTVR